MKKCPVLALFVIGIAFFAPSVSAQNPDGLNIAGLDTAVTGAKEARKKAGDFESNSYFPGEWEAAETQFTQAVLLSDNTNNDIGKAITAYNKAAGSFDRVFELAIPLYAQAREDEIMTQRGYLTAMRAAESFHAYLMDADKTALLALAQYKEGDYYRARDSAANALLKYKVLDAAYRAWLLRREIHARGFEGYDPDDYEEGYEILRGAMDAYTKGDLAAAQEKANEALAKYNQVILIAWENYAELRCSLAEGERLAALDMKTNIAAKEFFRRADSDNKTALDLLESKCYEDAAKLFINAEAMFVIASIKTLEKRRFATAAIKNANEKIQESERIARNVRNTRNAGTQKIVRKIVIEGD